MKFTPPTAEDSDAFLEGKRSARLPLAYDDIVRVLSGAHKEEEGWIVGLVESAPEPRYTVELCSGRGDLYLRLSEIQAIQRDEEKA